MAEGEIQFGRRRNTVWQRGEIQFRKAEKYSLAERRNTDYCAAGLGGRASSDDRVCGGGRRHKGCSRCVQQSGYATPSHRPHHHHHHHHHRAFHQTKAMPLFKRFCAFETMTKTRGDWGALRNWYLIGGNEGDSNKRNAE